MKRILCFSEHNQDGYFDSANESDHTVPRACNSSGVEANEDVLDPWGESVLCPVVVTDDSNVVVGNTGREIILRCFIFFQLTSLLLAFRIQPIKSIVYTLYYF